MQPPVDVAAKPYVLHSAAGTCRYTLISDCLKYAGTHMLDAVADGGGSVLSNHSRIAQLGVPLQPQSWQNPPR